MVDKNTPDQMLTVKQFAEKVNMTPGAIDYHIRRGRIKFIKVESTRWKFKRIIPIEELIKEALKIL